MILEGLPSEFAPVVSVTESKFGLMDLDEVEILLLAHGLHFLSFKKQSVPNLVSLNLTHVAPNSTNSEEVSPISTDCSPSQPPSHNHEQEFHGFHGNRGTHGDRKG